MTDREYNAKRQRYNETLAEAKRIKQQVEAEQRDLTPEEEDAVRGLISEHEEIKGQLDGHEARLDALEAVDKADTEAKSWKPRVSKPSYPFPNVSVGKRARYSINKALCAIAENRALKGFEAEVNQELEGRMGKSATGFYMPLDVREFEQRDMTTTTGTGAVGVTLEKTFIELLRAKTVCDKLGATFLTNMNGKFSLPRLNGASTAYWVTEGTCLTTSNETFDQVAFNNKTLGATVDISRKFLYQAAIDAEQMVQDDMAKVLGIELDRAALNGSGTGAVPTGILQNSSVPTIVPAADSANGGAVTFADMVKMESTVAQANAEIDDTLAYALPPSQRGVLKTATKAGTFPVFVYENDEINGHKALASSQLPNNLTKGTGTNLSAIIYGAWSQLVIATWGNGVDVVVNPYFASQCGTLRISMLLEADVQVRHPEAFCKITSAI